MSNLSANIMARPSYIWWDDDEVYIMARTSYIWWDDDDVYIALDQHT